MPRGALDLPDGGRLAVFAKAPIAGYAKTRLIPRLGAAGAAELHALLVTRTLETARQSGFSEVSLWCAPDRNHPFFVACRRDYGLRMFDQPNGDLGRRIWVAFESLLAAGEPALLVGTDCPALSPEHLHAAWSRLLTGGDAVFVPAVDGGYALIGLRRIDPLLFQDIPWGTPTVMAVTRSRLTALGWSVQEFPPLWDVDEPEDLDRLAELLPGLQRDDQPDQSDGSGVERRPLDEEENRRTPGSSSRDIPMVCGEDPWTTSSKPS